MEAEKTAQPQNIFEGISPEVMYQIDGGVFAFEGVSPNIDETQAAAIESRLRIAFDQVHRMWFENALGLKSVFWRCWVDRLHFESVSFDGKIVAGSVPLGAPPWAECGAVNTQRPRGLRQKIRATIKAQKEVPSNE